MKMRITESELNRMVKNGVRKTLNEISANYAKDILDRATYSGSDRSLRGIHKTHIENNGRKYDERGRDAVGQFSNVEDGIYAKYKEESDYTPISKQAKDIFLKSRLTTNDFKWSRSYTGVVDFVGRNDDEVDAEFKGKAVVNGWTFYVGGIMGPSGSIRFNNVGVVEFKSPHGDKGEFYLGENQMSESAFNRAVNNSVRSVLNEISSEYIKKRLDYARYGSKNPLRFLKDEDDRNYYDNYYQGKLVDSRYRPVADKLSRVEDAMYAKRQEETGYDSLEKQAKNIFMSANISPKALKWKQIDGDDFADIDIRGWSFTVTGTHDYDPKTHKLVRDIDYDVAVDFTTPDGRYSGHFNIPRTFGNNS